ncbi:MAG: hypothetical protein ACTSWQ_05830, partial [Candidatus Thorarchaeota archaeon]
MVVDALSSTRWIHKTDFPVTINEFDQMDIILGGRRVGVFYTDNHDMNYNFFDLDNENWSFGSFKPLSVSKTFGNYIDVAIAGDSLHDEGRISIAWTSMDNGYTYLNMARVRSDGAENMVGTSWHIETVPQTVVTDGDYLIDGYKKLAVFVDDDLEVIGVGSKSSRFTWDGVDWEKEGVDFQFVNGGFVFDDVKIVEDGNMRMIL